MEIINTDVKEEPKEEEEENDEEEEEDDEEPKEEDIKSVSIYSDGFKTNIVSNTVAKELIDFKKTFLSQEIARYDKKFDGIRAQQMSVPDLYNMYYNLWKKHRKNQDDIKFKSLKTNEQVLKKALEMIFLDVPTEIFNMLKKYKRPELEEFLEDAILDKSESMISKYYYKELKPDIRQMSIITLPSNPNLSKKFIEDLKRKLIIEELKHPYMGKPITSPEVLETRVLQQHLIQDKESMRHDKTLLIENKKELVSNILALLGKTNSDPLANVLVNENKKDLNDLLYYILTDKINNSKIYKYNKNLF